MSVQDRIENDLFFASVARRHGPASVPEDVFYAGRPRPPPETSLVQLAAATPMRYGLVLFALGWASILFQRNFLQQLVFGAPVFEELAKLGPAIVLVTLLRLRSPLARAPVAWLSGAAFGYLEHVLTYADEDPLLFTGRILFHAGSAALSMVVFTAIEHAPDVRSRWVSTAPSTLLHWANNFGALVLGIASIVAPALDAVARVLPFVATAAIYALLCFALGSRGPFEAFVARAIALAVPRLGLRLGEERGLQQL